MENGKIENKKTHWYEWMPNSFVLLFLIIVFMTILTYVIPAGMFDRVEKAGRMVVNPETFHRVDQSPVGLWAMFKSLPQGMVAAAIYIVNILIAGAMMKVLYVSGAIENVLGVSIRKLGVKNDTLVVAVMSIIFVLLGALVGFENSIALVPIAGMVSMAIGGDMMLGALIAVGGIGTGFAVHPFQPATVGTAHAIAELPMFSGAALRGLFMAMAAVIVMFHNLAYLKRIKKDPEKSLSKDIDTEGFSLSKPLEDYHILPMHKIVFGIFVTGILIFVYGAKTYGWFMVEQVTVFIVIAILCGLVAGLSPNKITDTMVQGATVVTGGAIIVGVARAIQVVMEQGRIADSIVYYLSLPLKDVPLIVSGILMTVVHSVINFFIPSGSGQAMATMPIMIPLADIIGMTRQTAVFAFQMGDGIMNLVVPTLGGLLAMLALLRIPFGRWFRVAFPLALKLLVASWIIVVIAVLTHWGPA
ncbi:MAG: TIGR00366 family protein [Synergistaceae bacterium]|jgi:uncharacterized ion transporter superfamily protein YfcC|nr:TIGR00366 family protein [Synergistaceae bacterium]